ncbi:MAG: site-2 protease family protein [bacterium]
MMLILSFVAVIISLSIHEFMHGFVAFLLGDQTAKRAGRLTLNPLAHIDPVGTIILPIMLAIAHLPVFGWAKPVPYNPYNLRDQRWGPVVVGLAGPASNLALFAASAFLLHTFAAFIPLSNLLLMFLLTMTIVNAALAVFNLIPIPPLDGSKILYLWADRPGVRRAIVFLELQGTWILIMYIILGAPGLSYLWSALINLAHLSKFFAYYAGVL